MSLTIFVANAQGKVPCIFSSARFEMPVISAAQAPQFAVAGTTFTSLAAPSRGATDTAVWSVEVASGVNGTPHRLTREEVFVAIAGCARVTISGESHDLAAGDALVVPPDTDFALSNPYGDSFKAIVAFPVGGQAVIPGKDPITPPWAA
jgi:mannose-6-phosphate isomerase-like protein (cupin superfamily)